MADPMASSRFNDAVSIGLRLLFFVTKVIIWWMFWAIVGLPSLVLLFVAFGVLMMGQLVKHGVHFDKLSTIKFGIRVWVFLLFIFVSFNLSLVCTICIQVWNLSQVVVFGLSLHNWDILITTFLYVSMIHFPVSFIPYFLPPFPLGRNESSFNVSEALLEIVDCLFLLWCVFKAIDKVPVLTEHEILGLYTWKWLRAMLLIIIGYNVVRLFTHLTTWLTRKVMTEDLDPRTMKNPHFKLIVEKLLPKSLIYYTNGLKTNITFVLCSLLNLLTWVFYFGSRLRETPQAEKLILFGERTCLSVLIFSVFWLFKSLLVLSWEASVMYDRLRSQLLDSKDLLYFLGLLGRPNHDIFKLTYYGRRGRKANVIFCMVFEIINPEFWNRQMSDKEDKEEGDSRIMESKMEEGDSGILESQNNKQVKKLSAKKREKIKYNLLMHNRTPNTQDMKQVADYLIAAKTALSDPKFVTSILDKLTPSSDLRAKLKHLIEDNSNRSASLAVVNQSGSEYVSIPGSPETAGVQPAEEDPVIEDDWLYFQKMAQINDGHCSETLVRSWMETAQNNCFFLASALSSTKDVVDILNTIVSCFLIGAAVISWLLLTRLATTKIIVLIVSPLLAATFIFGDTCKMLFQGLMYVYVVHPIHVGDLCCVDKIKLVVQSVDVWTTTFCKVEKLGTSEVVTYPNSELAKKIVTNNLSEFVWDDSLEIPLGSTLDKHFVKKLKHWIKDYLKGEDELMSCSHTVKAMAEEDDDEDLKMVIKLKYKIVKIQHWSYDKCVRRKDTLKDAVEERIQQLKEEQNTARYNAGSMTTPNFDRL